MRKGKIFEASAEKGKRKGFIRVGKTRERVRSILIIQCIMEDRRKGSRKGNIYAVRARERAV